MLKNLKIALLEQYELNKRSQGSVGLQCGITESRMSHIVAGRKPATKRERIALVKVLKKSEKHLFGEN